MNVITVNGTDYEVTDSFMPVLMRWVEYATAEPEEGTQREPVMGSIVNAMIQERYGPNMKWTDFTIRNYDDEQCYVTEVELAEQERIHPEATLAVSP